MVYENETFCENHDSHLDVKFHNFDIRESPRKPDAMEPTGEPETPALPGDCFDSPEFFQLNQLNSIDLCAMLSKTPGRVRAIIYFKI